MAPKFSIIIPTYNVEQYIARALESCINQTFGDIEILVVDDRGCDKSVEIAKEYARLDSRIQILSNPSNLGTFASRLKGMKQASGAYIMFIDADDYLVLNACEQAYQAAQNNTYETDLHKQLPDIVHFKATYLGNKNASPLENLKHKMRYILPTQWSATPLKNTAIAYNFFLKSKHFPKFTLWDKCYKASLIKQALPYFKHCQDSLNMAEDMLKFFVLANLAKSYVGVDSRLYVYCLNTTSITQNSSAHTKKIRDMRYVIQALQAIGKELHAPYAMRIAETMISHLHALIILESRFDTLEREHNIKLLSVTLHNNKLRLGHLKGNRFFIRLKKVGQAQASKLESVLGIVGKNGFPNFFGFQRFGIYGDNYKLGWAHHNATKAVHKHSVPNDTSYAALFSTYMNQNKPKIPKLQRTMRDFLIASYQSFLFNAWLEARVHLSVWVNTFSPAEMKEILAHKLYHNSPKQTQQQPWQDFLDSEYSQNFISTLLAHNIKENLTSLYGQTQIFKLLSGDLCCHYPYGKLFMLESINAYESERFAQRGFAPTGLLSGKHQKLSMGSALALECAFLENLNVSSARRYAWVWADDIQSVYKPQDAHFELNFSLPKGAYATTFLEQLARKKLHYTIAKEELV